MSNLSIQRRLASKIMGVGVNRVWIDEDNADKVELALTRKDVRSLIKDGTIKKRPKKGISRGRARAVHLKKRRGQRAGPGSRKGTANARLPFKTRWINKVRSQRQALKELRDGEYIDVHTYRILYRQVKGGMFRSVRYMKNYIKEHGLAIKRLPE